MMPKSPGSASGSSSSTDPRAIEQSNTARELSRLSVTKTPEFPQSPLPANRANHESIVDLDLDHFKEDDNVPATVRASHTSFATITGGDPMPPATSLQAVPSVLTSTTTTMRSHETSAATVSITNNSMTAPATTCSSSSTPIMSLGMTRTRSASSSNSQANNINNNHKRKKPSEQQRGETILDRLIQHAEYEIQHDSYRVMNDVALDSQLPSPRQAATRGNRRKQAENPWLSCLCGKLTSSVHPRHWLSPLNSNNHPNSPSQVSMDDADQCFTVAPCSGNAVSSSTESMDLNDHIEDLDEVTTRVLSVSQTRCPTLAMWTQEAMIAAARKPTSRAGNKRKRNNTSIANVDVAPPVALIPFGRRPDDPHVRFVCDYNPLCWMSMGGMIDEALAARCQDVVGGFAEHTTAYSQQPQPPPHSSSTNNKSHDPLNEKTHLVDGGGLEAAQPRTAHHRAGNHEDHLPEVQSKYFQTKRSTVTNNVDGGEEDEGDVIFLEVRTTLDTSSGGVAADSNPVSGKSKEPPGGVKARSPLQRQLDTPTLKPYLPKLTTSYWKERLPLEKQAWDSQDSSSLLYSAKTTDMLNKIRKSQWVEVAPIQRYLQEILKSLTCALPVEDCLRTIRQRHRAMIFHNPLVAEADHSSSAHDGSDQIQLAMPPGISNLGATCYLNTQLQCLAQNRVFIEGIFSWQAPQRFRAREGESIDDLDAEHCGGNTGADTSDRMDSVIALFQELLAKMNAGAYCTVGTLEFSNSLGLDHYEQQDPNEFSRLLLERIHESFSAISNKQSSDHGNAENGPGPKIQQKHEGHDLAELLPHLFQGVLVYETTCLSCKSKSQRSEEFMDINLPIVRPTEEDLKRKTGQLSILEAFSRKADTDVQFCLDEYCRPEVLDGDNQYFCNACKRKQDAERASIFQKLPPVLNVQLSRYVFDRTKLMKKKLEDEVLLPLDLYVEAKSRDEEVATERHRYILCAVMRHKGKSAYSGHYVAESMDWLTGQWYEFNDETVTLLDKGPSCCFQPAPIPKHSKNHPHSRPNGVKSSNKGESPLNVVGSKDAYNMYYVEESFLAQSTLNCLRVSNVARTSQSASVCALDSVVIRRSAVYAELAQLCMEDETAAKRLVRRREFIKENLLSSLFFPNLSTVRNFVWVDGDAFRRFLSCRDRTDNHKGPRAMVQSAQSFLCSHGRLHPRRARKGKLIPKEVFDAYQSCRSQEGQRHDNEAPITAGNSIVCTECHNEYWRQLSDKVDHIKTLKLLYDAMDPKQDDLDLEVDEGAATATNCDGMYAYVVAKQFISWFRKQVGRLFKFVSELDSPKGCKLFDTIKRCCTSNDLECIAEGLDAIDLMKLGVFDISEDEEDGEIIKVNGAITCPHGKLFGVDKRRFRYVSWPVWNDLIAIFPHAIEHQLPRKIKTCSVPTDGSIFRCEECEASGAVDDDKRMLSKLKDLGDLAKSRCWSLTQRSLIDRERVYSSADFKYYLIHSDEIEAINRFLNAFSPRSTSGKNANVESFVSKLLRSLSIPVHPFMSVAPPENDLPALSMRWLSSIYRPVLCLRHRKPIRSAIFQQNRKEDCDRPPLLARWLQIMEEPKLRDFLGLATMVMRCFDGELDMDTTRICLSDRYASIDPNQLDFWYPRFAASSTRTTDQRSFAVSSPKASMIFSLESSLCEDKQCNAEFSLWQEAADRARATLECKNSGSAADDPLLIDSDAENMTGPDARRFPLRVFRIQPHSTDGSILASLSSCHGLAPVEQNNLRRSGRRKRARFPVGVIEEEEFVEVDVQKNMASIRMLLYERCSGFDVNHRIRLVVASPLSDKQQTDIDETEDTSEKKSVQAKIIELPISDTQSTLRAVYEAAANRLWHESSDISEDIMLIRSDEKEGDSTDSSKESLMDLLIREANTTNEGGDSGLGDACEKKRKARTEKGFSGTLLSSGRRPLESNETSAEVASDSDSSSKRAKSTDGPALSLSNTSAERASSTALATTASDDIGSPRSAQSSIAKGKRGGASSCEVISCDDEDGDEPGIWGYASGSQISLQPFLNGTKSRNQMDGEIVSSPEMLAGESKLPKFSLDAKPKKNATNTAHGNGTLNHQLTTNDAEVDFKQPFESEDLVSQIAKRLMKDANIDAEVAVNAASWTTSENPGTYNIDDLYDTAFAKSIDLQPWT